ncbi:hypothetical protein ETAA8_19020 [Anatilimnocola aggregata]|uniref:Uncharacterized protein n=1 Tax=Anatilimnocola aggregata TaxID=2528021 RepID=A0A517Y9A9_9BACT|nr:hypothetical protein [Anatilimnocola aggregata]QDU26819.1 hypothetical protein ETAA8_19020 [Anatilimnocola aggregata]
MEILPDHLKGQSLYDRSYQKRTEALTTAAADPRWAETWTELGQGAPTLAGLARICSTALATGGAPDLPLSLEAKALLIAAKNRGTLEIKGSNRAFDAPGRMLAVYVEAAVDRTLIFRSRENPAFTIRFLAGFRELCQAGLVMHHIYHEFSLTREGFERAETVDPAEVETLLSLATDLGVLE